MIFNEFNHNEYGNPHPQYSKLKYATAAPTQANGWNLIIDKTFKNTLATGVQTKPLKFSFSSIIYSNKGNQTHDMYIVSCAFYAKDVDAYECSVDTKALIDNSKDNDMIRAVVKLTNDGYRLRVYVKNIGVFGQVLITPIICDTIEYISENTPIFSNMRCNFKEKCDDALSVCGLEQNILAFPEGDLILSSSFKVIRNETNDMFSANNASLIKFSPSEGAWLNKISGGEEGQILLITQANGTNCTVNSMQWYDEPTTTNILLTGGKPKILGNQTFYKLMKVGKVWVEM